MNKKCTRRGNTQKTVMLNSFQHLHFNQPSFKAEEILNQVQDDNRRGFTLIELLVVVLIIGILVAVALPQYNKAVIKSKYSTLKHMVEALAQAEEIYYLENGQYTTAMDDLSIEMPNGTLDNEFDVENEQRYLYDWGYCQLVNKASDKRAMCIDNSINMGYRRYFTHSPNHSNTRRCDVRKTLDETVPQAAVCKIETRGGTRYTSTDSLIQSWVYQ